MPNDHDIVRVTDRSEGSVVECNCGRKFTALSADDARWKHEGHHGVEKIRAEMRRIESR
jgi:hypothetical protein